MPGRAPTSTLAARQNGISTCCWLVTRLASSHALEGMDGGQLCADVAEQLRLLLSPANNAETAAAGWGKPGAPGELQGKPRAPLERSPARTLRYASIGPTTTPKLLGGHSTTAKHTKQFRAAAEEQGVPALMDGSRHDVAKVDTLYAVATPLLVAPDQLIFTDGA